MEETTKKPRRRFDEQFKRDAVRLISNGDRNMSEVARDLGVGVALLRRWREKFAEGTMRKGKVKVKSVEQIENEKLRHEQSGSLPEAAHWPSPDRSCCLV